MRLKNLKFLFPLNSCSVLYYIASVDVSDAMFKWQRPDTNTLSLYRRDFYANWRKFSFSVEILSGGIMGEKAVANVKTTYTQKGAEAACFLIWCYICLIRKLSFESLVQLPPDVYCKLNENGQKLITRIFELCDIFEHDPDKLKYWACIIGSVVRLQMGGDATENSEAFIDLLTRALIKRYFIWDGDVNAYDSSAFLPTFLSIVAGAVAGGSMQGFAAGAQQTALVTENEQVFRRLVGAMRYLVENCAANMTIVTQSGTAVERREVISPIAANAKVAGDSQFELSKSFFSLLPRYCCAQSWQSSAATIFRGWLADFCLDPRETQAIVSSYSDDPVDFLVGSLATHCTKEQPRDDGSIGIRHTAAFIEVLRSLDHYTLRRLFMSAPFAARVAHFISSHNFPMIHAVKELAETHGLDWRRIVCTVAAGKTALERACAKELSTDKTEERVCAENASMIAEVMLNPAADSFYPVFSADYLLLSPLGGFGRCPLHSALFCSAIGQEMREQFISIIPPRRFFCFLRKTMGSVITTIEATPSSWPIIKDLFGKLSRTHQKALLLTRMGDGYTVHAHILHDLNRLIEWSNRAELLPVLADLAPYIRSLDTTLDLAHPDDEPLVFPDDADELPIGVSVLPAFVKVAHEAEAARLPAIQKTNDNEKMAEVASWRRDRDALRWFILAEVSDIKDELEHRIEGSDKGRCKAAYDGLSAAYMDIAQALVWPGNTDYSAETPFYEIDAKVSNAVLAAKVKFIADIAAVESHYFISDVYVDLRVKMYRAILLKRREVLESQLAAAKSRVEQFCDMQRENVIKLAHECRRQFALNTRRILDGRCDDALEEQERNRHLYVARQLCDVPFVASEEIPWLCADFDKVKASAAAKQAEYDEFMRTYFPGAATDSTWQPPVLNMETFAEELARVYQGASQPMPMPEAPVELAARVPANLGPAVVPDPVPDPVAPEPGPAAVPAVLDPVPADPVLDPEDGEPDPAFLGNIPRRVWVTAGLLGSTVVIAAVYYLLMNYYRPARIPKLA
ncbi:MAG: hypothetical protein LBF84_02875 [Holosporales bacterium]|jgi:hypothetical protein|nr:hypothetical protein [Holosporales bacterium]